MVLSIWHTYHHVFLFFLLTVNKYPQNSNYMLLAFSLMFLCLLNCKKAMIKTQIHFSRVTKYANITKSRTKTACFPVPTTCLNQNFTP